MKIDITRVRNMSVLRFAVKPENMGAEESEQRRINASKYFRSMKVWLAKDDTTRSSAMDAIEKCQQVSEHDFHPKSGKDINVYFLQIVCYELLRYEIGDESNCITDDGETWWFDTDTFIPE